MLGMTPREQAFLDAIIRSPGDDHPRLVFADYLEEVGNEARAEFIRVQIELPKYKHACCPNMRKHKDMPELYGLPIYVDGSECGKCRWCQLVKRERELWTGCDVPLDGIPDEWIPTLGRDARSIVRANGSHVIYGRGFVEKAVCSASDWLAHADELMRGMPLREVELTTRPDIESWDDRENACYRILLRAGSRLVNASISHKEIVENVRTLTEYDRESAWVIERILKNHWPRIAFTLPPAP